MALLPSLYSIELLCMVCIAMVCAPASIWLTGDLQRAPGKLLGAYSGQASGELTGGLLWEASWGTLWVHISSGRLLVPGDV